MIHVCDAIMGSGKSSAAITYMNEHPEKCFVYITPYLEEAARIKSGCPKLKFVEPSSGISQCGFTKTGHTLKLLEEGRNIATTHQAFTYYTQDTIDAIHDAGYTLIIDESVNVLETVKYDPYDMSLLVRSGLLVEKDGRISASEENYTGKAFKEMMRLIRSRELIHSSTFEDGEEVMYYWLLPATLMNAFDDVFILTYLFDGQDIHHFLVMNEVPYERVWVVTDENGVYRFSDSERYIPEYTKTLSSKIHICEHDKLNSVGENYYALSMNWFDSRREEVEVLKNNIYNYFRNIVGDSRSSERMWGTYSDKQNALRGRGYSNKYLVFNSRAENKYRDRSVLVYAANPFMNVGHKRFYEKCGVAVDDDAYSLSTMIQWIWRSAIRDGREIWIYIPSSRMRRLLKEWIARVEAEYKEYENRTAVIE